MPSSYTHAAAGLAVASLLRPRDPPRGYWLAAAACAVLPDVDLVGWPLGIPDASVFGHRALTHSLLAALVFGYAAARLVRRPTLWATYAAVAASHGALDALTTYSLGVAF